MKHICVYCGSSVGDRPAFRRLAERLADGMVERGLALVYGGGKVGLMGVIADRVLARGGRAIGVIPHALMTKEIGHAGLTEQHVVASMHERKALMESLSDGFIAMPGGLGTMEEIFEMLTWAQLGLHRKPCGFLDAEDYYRPLMTWIDDAVARGFVRAEHRRIVLHGTEPHDLLAQLEAFEPLALPKWIDSNET